MRNPRRYAGILLFIAIIVIVVVLLAFFSPGPGGNPSGEPLEPPPASAPSEAVEEPAAGGNPSGEPLEEPEPSEASEEELPETGGP